MAQEKSATDREIARQNTEVGVKTKLQKQKPIKTDPTAATATKALELIAGHMEDMKEIAKAPRKLVRDAQGRAESSVLEGQ